MFTYIYVYTIHTHTHTTEREGGEREGKKEGREGEWRERDIGKEKEKQGHDINVKLGDLCEDLNLKDTGSITEITGRENVGKIFGKGGGILLLVEYYCLG